jgi:DNA-binding NarL/FixJ family response regulator
VRRQQNRWQRRYRFGRTPLCELRGGRHHGQRSPIVSAHCILVVDDQEFYRVGLGLIIGQQADLRVAATAADADEARSLLERQSFDLALVELALPGSSGLDLLWQIARQHPQTRVIAFTVHREAAHWQRAMAAGARGFVNKRSAVDELIQAIRVVLGGSVYLSAPAQAQFAEMARATRRPQASVGLESLSNREFEVLSLIGRGLGTSEIAAHIGRSIKTVETHKANLKTKLAVANSTELFRFAMQWVVDGGFDDFGKPDKPDAD